MTHRGRAEQLRRSAEILRGLGLPFLAVPGNHDIPYTFPARFTRTFVEWERAFGETEPSHASETVVVVGLNSVRPWRQQGGALRDEQLASRRLAARRRAGRRVSGRRPPPPPRGAAVARRAEEAGPAIATAC